MTEATSKPPFVRLDGLEWKYDSLNFQWFVEAGPRGRDYRRISPEVREAIAQEQAQLHQQGRVDRMDFNNISTYPNDQSTLKPARGKVLGAKQSVNYQAKLKPVRDRINEGINGNLTESEPDPLRPMVQITTNHKQPLMRSKQRK